MIGRIGPTELVLILTIALIIFGPKKLPEIGKAVGSAIREFKNHSNKLQKELDITGDDQENTQETAKNITQAKTSEPVEQKSPEPVEQKTENSGNSKG